MKKPDKIPCGGLFTAAIMGKVTLHGHTEEKITAAAFAFLNAGFAI